MNATGIEWTDRTLNVLSGCDGPNNDGRHCTYCYAKRLAHGRLRRLYLANRIYVAGDPSDPFAPRFWPKRLEQPARIKKPCRIFVCSMGELFNPKLPDSWLQAVFAMIEANPRHTFQLLTHQPDQLARFSPFPDHCWVGATATNASELFHASAHLHAIKAHVRFASIEPLLSPIDIRDLAALDWIIIGAQTGPGAKPVNRQDVHELIDAADRRGIPVFLKDNLHWPDKRQEWPQ